MPDRFLGVILCAALAAAACTREHTFEKPPVHVNPNMDLQEKAVAQGASDFFADGKVMRPKLAGTVAREDPIDDGGLAAGVDATGAHLTTSPVPVDEATLARGEERYGIYCSPCHGARGDGQGMLTQRAGVAVTSLLDPRLVATPDGQIVEVIDRGLGLMPSYRSQVPPADRWAIVAHIRRLQAAAPAEPVSDAGTDVTEPEVPAADGGAAEPPADAVEGTL
ncbi:MAG: c-type cytochrome [Thermoanaerobaculia bacterium]